MLPAGRSWAPARSASRVRPLGSRPSARPPGSPAEKIDAAKAAALPAISASLAANPIKARVTVSGYEGSELLVARLLIEAGADVPYVGTACPRTEWSDPDREWLEAKGTHIQYRASIEQDIAAMLDAKPDLALGTTPLVQKAKELGMPAHLLHQHGFRPAPVRCRRCRRAGRPSSPRKHVAANASAAWSSSSAAPARAMPPATAGPACRPIIRPPRRATARLRVRVDLADAVGV